MEKKENMSANERAYVYLAKALQYIYKKLWKKNSHLFVGKGSFFSFIKFSKINIYIYELRI